MLIIGVILLIAALVCLYLARDNASRLAAMNAADTYTAQQLQELHQKITTSLGGDALAQACEVEGVIECDEPLVGPVSGTPCVAYARTLVREYEAQVTEKDAQGKEVRRIERRSETLESEERHVNFYVRDASGRMLICPEGAELDLVETANRYEEAPPGQGGRTRTLGHRRQERALPVGTKVYILGHAVDNQGQPMIGCHPRNKKQRFLISRRPEHELASSAASSTRNFYYAAMIAGALGGVLLIWGLIA